MKRALLAAAVTTAALAAVAFPSMAGAALPPPVTTYDSTFATLPGNVTSYGFEAYSLKEVGDEIQLNPGTSGLANTITFTMSSWACQQGAWNTNDCVTNAPSTKAAIPVRLNIYGASQANDDGTVTPGALLFTTSQTFLMPYRPSANISKCNNFNGATNLGKWYSKSDGKCYNGKAFNIVYNLKSLKLHLPDDFVVALQYNTTSHGPNPIGVTDCNSTSQGCFYDSLNVGTGGPGTTVGSKPYPGTIFQNTSYAGFLCDSTPHLDEFNLDSPTNACWAGYEPEIKVTTR